MKDIDLGVDIDIYLPENVKISLDKNTDFFVENYFEPIESKNKFDEVYILNDNKLFCSSCQKIETSGNLVE